MVAGEPNARVGNEAGSTLKSRSGSCRGARHLQGALVPRGSARAAARRLPCGSRAAVPGGGGDAGGGRERVQPLGKEPEPSRILKRPQ